MVANKDSEPTASVARFCMKGTGTIPDDIIRAATGYMVAASGFGSLSQ